MNFRDMLGSYNILNTSKISFYSNNFKDITISNQQVTKNNVYVLKFLNMIFQLWRYMCFLDILRDYTRKVILLFRRGWLRYSPAIRTLNTSNHKGVFLTVDKDKNNKLDPMWVTGFTDAEGCFSIIIVLEEGKPSLKWKIRSSFEINLHLKDIDILYKIQSYFGIGSVSIRREKNIAVYRVSSLSKLNEVIIPHFLKYPLISEKSLDFLLWRKVINIISDKKHLTKEGFWSILSYYASINRGISVKVKKYYPNITPEIRPLKTLPVNLNPQWVSGFVAGDGGFSIYVSQAKDYILGEKVYCRFHIAQHSKDIELIKLFIKFFNCGLVHLRANKSTPRCDFFVQDHSSLLNNIIPHFDQYPLLNLKQEDFFCFKQAITIIKSKGHLTQEGLNIIKSINKQMNSNRLV